jgi:hypothetical protein
MEIPGVKQIKHASSKAGLKLFLLALIATGALYFQLLYVEQYDFSKDFDREKVLNKIKKSIAESNMYGKIRLIICEIIGSRTDWIRA